MIISFKGMLVPLMLTAALTSCNSYLKPEDTKASISKLNDTTFLVQSYKFSSYAYDAAQLANSIATTKDFKNYVQEIAAFQGSSKSKLDSLSRIKGIKIPEEMPRDFQKSLTHLKRLNSKSIEPEFLNQIEHRLVKQIDFLENFGKNSENDETITLAALLLSGMQQELQEIAGLRQKIANQ